MTDTQQWSSDARKTAFQLKNSICNSDFIVSLVILENVSGLMLPASRLLQTLGLDLVRAMGSVCDLLSSLRSMRTVGVVSKLFEESTAVAKILGVILVKPRSASRSVYRPTAASTAQDSVEDYYKINVFFSTLDSIICDNERRFGQKQQQALYMSGLIPWCMLFEVGDEERQWQQLMSGVEVYKDIF